MHNYNSFDRRVGPHEQNMVDKHVFSRSPKSQHTVFLGRFNAKYTKYTPPPTKNSQVCLPGATVVILTGGITIYLGGGVMSTIPG